jgi:surface protein
MESIFENCISLKSLNLSNFNTSKVSDMSGMFEGCESLQYLDISHFSTNSLGSQDNLNGAFDLIENSIYLNLFNIEDEHSKITQQIKDKTNFIICSKENENEN